MIKFLARDSLTFDVETIPDVEAGRRMAGVDIRTDVLGESKIMEWMWELSPDYDEETNPRPFLKPILQKIVSIATVRRHLTADGFKVSLKVIEDPPMNTEGKATK
jgi:predicted PolB exonuclease-like 3'-5' exonuclease